MRWFGLGGFFSSVLRRRNAVGNIRIKGTVRWFDGSKGFGYIQSEQGREVFVHYTAICDKGIRILAPGQQVEFAVQDSVRGPQAAEVVRV